MFSFSTFLITFREFLEAALIVGIVLATLGQTQNERFNRFVYLGIGGGLTVALILAYVFEAYLGGFEGRNEELFEGIVMLSAMALITWMILWMKKQKFISERLKKQVATHVEKEYPFGIFLLTLLSVGREGVETVLFLNASRIAGETTQLWSGVLGMVLAAGLSYALFAGTRKIPLKHFFNLTSVLLILFAAGLTAHGIHELQEAGLLTIGVQELWNTNPFLDEKGVLGSTLKALFGYNGNPSALEGISYFSYLILILGVYFHQKTKLKRTS